MGLIYTLNFSQSFGVSQNFSNILSTISVTGGEGATNNFGQQYLDGAMFANDGEFFTYGGVAVNTSLYAPQSASSVLYYQKNWYGPPGANFRPGFAQGSLPPSMTRYLTYGAAVSVPSENMGYYFGGLRSSSSGPIFYGLEDETVTADVLSTTLISVNMTVQHSESWANQTLPTTVPGRANAELVWLPVGKQGILVAIGGVIYPEYAYVNQSDTPAQISASVSVYGGR